MTDGARVGDRVLYAGRRSGVWALRSEKPSLVVHVGAGKAAAILVDDPYLDPWWARLDDLVVIGRAVYADLRPLVPGEVPAGLAGSTVALDFDGPIHSYRRGWTGYVPEDPPAVGALEFVAALQAAGCRVVVHTSRADCLPGKEGVRSYLRQHGFPPLEVTYEKVPAAAYIDDRAVHFDPRRGYDDALRAELVRMCRTRHSGEYHPDERHGGDSADHCGNRGAHGPHTWMPKPPRVGISRDCPGTWWDTESSASRQHFIDTGEYLPAGTTEGTGP